MIKSFHACNNCNIECAMLKFFLSMSESRRGMMMMIGIAGLLCAPEKKLSLTDIAALKAPQKLSN